MHASECLLPNLLLCVNIQLDEVIATLIMLHTFILLHTGQEYS